MAKQKQIDTEQQVETMAAAGCQWDEIALLTGLSRATLSRRGYVTAIQRGHAKEKNAIRMALKRLLDKDDVPTVLHLARSVLGQNYKQELQLSTGETIADTHEAKRDVLRRLSRVAAALGAGIDHRQDADVDVSGVGQGLRVLGTGESAGADG